MHIQKNKIKFWKLCGKFHLQWWVSLKIERLQIWWFIMVCHSYYSPAYIAVENCTFIDYLPLRMVIFHGYVSLPEGILWGIPWIGGIPCEFFSWRNLNLEGCALSMLVNISTSAGQINQKNLLQVPTQLVPSRSMMFPYLLVSKFLLWKCPFACCWSYSRFQSEQNIPFWQQNATCVPMRKTRPCHSLCNLCVSRPIFFLPS